MKVHLIRRETVDAYKKENAQSRVSFDEWLVKLKYAFGDTQVHLFICWIGTHAEYDRLCKAGEQYSISNY